MDKDKRKRTSKRVVTIIILALLLIAVLVFDGWMYIQIRDTVLDLNNQLDAAKVEQELLTSINGTLEEENESLFRELNEEKENGQQSGSQMSELQQQLSEKTKEAEALKSERDTLQKEKDDLQKELNTVNQALEDLQNAVTAAEENKGD